MPTKPKTASLWTRAAKSKEERDELRLNLAAAEPIMQILEGFVEAKLSENERQEADYSDASWSHKAADNNGYRRALRDMQHLIANRNV